MSKPAEAWYPYMKTITRRYPNNRHPEENAAVADALRAARPETQQIVELVFLRKTKTLPEAANLVYISYSTARRLAAGFLGDVAARLGLPGK